MGRQTVYLYLREGTLRRAGGTSYRALLDEEEVRALAQVRKEKLPISHVQRTLITERAVREGLERRLERLERMLGVRSPVVCNNEAEVVRLVARVREAVEEPPTNILEIADWCSIFFGLQEETFYLIEAYTGDPEPHAPFLCLAEKMYEYCERNVHNQDVEEAYTELASARRALRHVVFFYLSQRIDRKHAQKVIPEAETSILRKLNSHVR